MTIGNWIIKAEQRGASPAIEYKDDKDKSKDKNKWRQMSWHEYIQKVIAAFLFLDNLSPRKKKHVGIISNTRWEWAALDLALLGSGQVVIPFYPNSSDEDLLHIVNHSEIDLLIIETSAIFLQIERIKTQFKKNVQLMMLSDIDFNLAISEKNRD